jgi:citrate lyase subunit beta/citryl-CoA lyase
MLYVPGNRPSRLQKSPRYGADAVILDLEDSVPGNEKESSRILIKYALREPFWGDTDRFVRINDLNSPYWVKDVECVVPETLTGLKIPKVESENQLRALDKELERIENGNGIRTGTTKLILTIETAKGLVNLTAICSASERTIGIGLGSEDLMTDTGIAREEMWVLRSQLTIIAKAFGYFVQDSVFPNFSDLRGLAEESRRSRNIGMDGKTAIHPDQIETLNAIFSPSVKEIEKAKKVLEMSVKENGRAFSFDGEMIDLPILERYRRIALQGGGKA